MPAGRRREYASLTHVRLEVTPASAVRGPGKPTRIGWRHFIVAYDASGNVLRIKERKQLQHPQLGVYDAPYWTAGAHVLGSGDTLPRQIIALATKARDAAP